MIPIICETPHLIAINKPPRIASVPGGEISLQKSALGMIQRQFESKGIKPYILHRLDYETSGVLLFGKFPRDRGALEGIFASKETRKKYNVLVKGVPHGKIITKKLPSRRTGEEIPAETRYKVMRIFSRGVFSLVEAEISTGRKHQIRRHFAAIGHPVVLDNKYGDERLNRKFRLSLRLGRLFLHAASISFSDPFTKQKCTIEAPLPIDLQAVLKKLSA